MSLSSDPQLTFRSSQDVLEASVTSQELLRATHNFQHFLIKPSQKKKLWPGSWLNILFRESSQDLQSAP